MTAEPTDPLAVFRQTGSTPPADDLVVIELSPEITTKRELMDVYASQLGCPWFGRNWDALADALTDLSWMEGKRLLLRHNGLPFSHGRLSLTVYLGVLIDAVQSWTSENNERLIVEIPRADDTSL